MHPGGTVHHRVVDPSPSSDDAPATGEFNSAPCYPILRFADVLDSAMTCRCITGFNSAENE
jgi:hypothetical protein